MDASVVSFESSIKKAIFVLKKISEGNFITVLCNDYFAEMLRSISKNDKRVAYFQTQPLQHQCTIIRHFIIYMTSDDLAKKIKNMQYILLSMNINHDEINIYQISATNEEMQRYIQKYHEKILQYIKTIANEEYLSLLINNKIISKSLLYKAIKSTTNKYDQKCKINAVICTTIDAVYLFERQTLIIIDNEETQYRQCQLMNLRINFKNIINVKQGCIRKNYDRYKESAKNEFKKIKLKRDAINARDLAYIASRNVEYLYSNITEQKKFEKNVAQELYNKVRNIIINKHNNYEFFVEQCYETKSIQNINKIINEQISAILKGQKLYYNNKTQLELYINQRRLKILCSTDVVSICKDKKEIEIYCLYKNILNNKGKKECMKNEMHINYASYKQLYPEYSIKMNAMIYKSIKVEKHKIEYSPTILDKIKNNAESLISFS